MNENNKIRHFSFTVSECDGDAEKIKVEADSFFVYMEIIIIIITALSETREICLSYLFGIEKGVGGPDSYFISILLAKQQ